MRRVLLAILAVIMLIVGASLLAVSAWIYAAFGTNGVATASLGSITSAPTSAGIVIDVEGARVSVPVLPVHGSTTLRLESSDGSDLLAGSHDVTAVNSFIGTREFDAAYRTNGEWSLSHVPGSGDSQPWAALPSWLTAGAAVEVDLREGQTVVISNASGSTGIEVQATLLYSAPRAPQAALALAISGGVLVLAGLALAFSTFWIMRRRPDDISS